MLNTEFIKKHSVKAHLTAKSKGWWNEMPDEYTHLSLLGDELSEAKEAFRGGKIQAYSKTLEYLKNKIDKNEIDADFVFKFMELQKDTMSDEIADVVIRAWDFSMGFGYDIEELSDTLVLSYPSFVNTFQKELVWLIENTKKSVSLALDSIVDKSNDTSKYIGYVISKCVNIAKVANFNLHLAIRLKLAYNSTRPHRHGNKNF